MKLRIDQHYLHPRHGALKFEGYWGIHYLFSTYEKFSRSGKFTQAKAALAWTKPDVEYAIKLGLRPCPPPA